LLFRGGPHVELTNPQGEVCSFVDLNARRGPRFVDDWRCFGCIQRLSSSPVSSRDARLPSPWWKLTWLRRQILAAPSTSCPSRARRLGEPWMSEITR